MLINGLTLQLDRNILPVVVKDPAFRHYLTFVTSDRCPYSRDEVAAWTQLLSAVTRDSRVAVLIVSLTGDRIPAALATTLEARGIPHRVLHVTNRTAFVEENGIVWTPATLLLDGDFRVRLVSERVTPAFSQEVASTLTTRQ